MGKTGGGIGTNQYKIKGNAYIKDLRPVPPVSLLSQMNAKTRDLVPLSHNAQKVLHAIRSVGGEPLLVGGCVRDALMDNRTSKDIDIEVHGGTSIQNLIDSLSLVSRVDVVGQSFGVIKATIGGETLDVSLPRRDNKVAAGHRGFEIVTDPNLTKEEASARRDFTINSIMWNPLSQEIVDPWNGVQDIQEGILRHTSAAFSEDPLRVLRGFQFASRFGYQMAPETVELCKQLSNHFS